MKLRSLRLCDRPPRIWSFRDAFLTGRRRAGRPGKLDLGAEVAYLRNLKKADAGYAGGRNRSVWIGKMRVQRDF